MSVSKQDLIKSLNLALHPLEGGYFKRIYESSQIIDSLDRKAMTSIHYMLTDDSPIGYLHKNKSDIMHYFHLGSPVRFFLLSPEGQLSECIMGADLENGEVLQLLVPAGYWKASILEVGEYSLISEAVCPGFEYEDNTLADTRMIHDQFGWDIVDKLKSVIKG